MLEQPTFNAQEQRPEPPEIEHLAPFDADYFSELEGVRGWIAIDRNYCKNQRYFTVLGKDGQKLGIVGLYDTDDEKNISHTIVDPKFRGLGLAKLFKERLLDATGETFYVATVDLDNEASLVAMAKIPGVQVISDEAYENEFHKRKFRFERSEPSEE